MSKYAHWKAFEREITKKMREVGYDSKRNWSNQFEETDTVDVMAPPYALQLKAGQRPNLVGAWEQAKENGKNLIPVGVARWKGKRKTLVCLDLETFLRLVEK